MEDSQILSIWKSGKSKYEVAYIYMDYINKFNSVLKIKKITKNQALNHVEKVIYKEVMSWKEV